MSKGVLYVVATPIGNLDDLSRRAVKVLSTVDLIAAEDTRHTRSLLRHYGIGTPMMAFHEHNEREAMERLLLHLAQGEQVALVSDAGTPLISDPGFPLVREARQRGIEVMAVPGPSAAIAALSVAGLPTDRFLFAGFPPRQGAQRRHWLEALLKQTATLLFYESSHRIKASLADMAAVFGSERQAVIARELTKLHETVLSGSLSSLIEQVEADANQRKGEFVLLLAGAEPVDVMDSGADAERILRVLAGELPLKQAAALTATITGLKKNALYQQALAWKTDS
ncbi:16S rRNA (cytidine(1402)-2'-O)-methyltransferase [endosymbiont of Ridgeia piscesae]|uniref:Ribosomal RNA small subunit methyltransferase I n=1 Tax=endosymbiont of Ridgeia piscesae TaxID=54398 RepID=A0A0T5YW52_9GAMM|nr:16S rRNA (cytidine(1402)-2'-O)-methyltransferase [endosymbiont of Ridgeia piscesae]KRT54582.1 16S rRNA (cytidine(1402)-2'-O)-methyltransferase [endosymbiont of Ridgeia piscesae]KRT59673.1 16S rRNA (cytidine1402-2'-O)-methyltransferase [endosymbiont of Ridgeia piscesae]